MVKNLRANVGDMGSIPDLGDPTCLGATKPMYHNSQAHVPELLKARVPRVCALQREKLPQ